MTTKKKITATAIVMFIILGSALITAAGRGTFTKVTCGSIDLTPSSPWLITPGGFCFDTGASGSAIFDDSLATIPFVGIGFNSSSDTRRPHPVTISFLSALSLSDRVTIDNILTSNQINNKHFRNKGIKIILGMDVIHKANWLFSFRENRAEALPLSQIPPSRATPSASRSATPTRRPLD